MFHLSRFKHHLELIYGTFSEDKTNFTALVNLMTFLYCHYGDLVFNVLAFNSDDLRANLTGLQFLLCKYIEVRISMNIKRP